MNFSFVSSAHLYVKGLHDFHIQIKKKITICLFLFAQRKTPNQFHSNQSHQWPCQGEYWGIINFFFNKDNGWETRRPSWLENLSFGLATIFFSFHSISFQITNPGLQSSLFSWQFWIRNVVLCPRLWNLIRWNKLFLFCEKAGEEVCPSKTSFLEETVWIFSWP